MTNECQMPNDEWKRPERRHGSRLRIRHSSFVIDSSFVILSFVILCAFQRLTFASNVSVLGECPSATRCRPGAQPRPSRVRPTSLAKGRAGGYEDRQEGTRSWLNATFPVTREPAASYCISKDTGPKWVAALANPTGFPLPSHSRSVPSARWRPSPSSIARQSRRHRTTATGVQRCWRSPEHWAVPGSWPRSSHHV